MHLMSNQYQGAGTNIDPECLRKIELMNQKKASGGYITAKERLELLNYDNDFFNNADINTLQQRINSVVFLNIQPRLINRPFEEVRAILRWCARGLDADVSISLVASPDASFFESSWTTIEEDTSQIRDLDFNEGSVGVLIMDIETTGGGNDDEIIHLSVINLRGQEVYESYFNPQKELPAEYSKAGKLTKKKLMYKPSWKNEWKLISRLLREYPVIMHNAKFNVRMIGQTCKKHNIDIDFRSNIICASNYIKEEYKVKKLEEAAIKRGYEVEKNKLHDATYNCQLLLKCLITPSIEKNLRRHFSTNPLDILSKVLYLDPKIYSQNIHGEWQAYSNQNVSGNWATPPQNSVGDVILDNTNMVIFDKPMQTNSTSMHNLSYESVDDIYAKKIDLLILKEVLSDKDCGSIQEIKAKVEEIKERGSIGVKDLTGKTVYFDLLDPIFNEEAVDIYKKIDFTREPLNKGPLYECRIDANTKDDENNKRPFDKRPFLEIIKEKEFPKFTPLPPPTSLSLSPLGEENIEVESPKESLSLAEALDELLESPPVSERQPIEYKGGLKKQLRKKLQSLK